MSTLGGMGTVHMDSVECDSVSNSPINRQAFNSSIRDGDSIMGVGTNTSIFKAVKNTLLDSKQQFLKGKKFDTSLHSHKKNGHQYKKVTKTRTAMIDGSKA
jgi:hypothetical protein